MNNKLTEKYIVDEHRIRFDWPTAAGEPPKTIQESNHTWYRQGWKPISDKPEITLVWYND